MNLNDLHRRLLQDVLEIGNALPLVITGGYAVQAHRIVDRFSRDIDMATDSTVAMETIVATVVEGLAERGWRVEVIGVDPHRARMMATDPGSGEQCELDILRESFQPAAGNNAVRTGTGFGRRYRHQGSSLGRQRPSTRSHRHPRRVPASDHC